MELVAEHLWICEYEGLAGESADILDGDRVDFGLGRHGRKGLGLGGGRGHHRPVFLIAAIRSASNRPSRSRPLMRERAVSSMTGPVRAKPSQRAKSRIAVSRSIQARSRAA